MKINVILSFGLLTVLMFLNNCSIEPSVKLKENKYFLDLSDKGLDTIPHFVLEDKRLQILTLAYNEFTEIPVELFNLTNLEKLEVRGNQLKTIPKEIKKLKKLEELDLLGNKIEHIPKEIGELISLKKLMLLGHNLNNKQVDELKKLLPSTEIILYLDSRLNQYVDK